SPTEAAIRAFASRYGLLTVPRTDSDTDLEAVRAWAPNALGHEDAGESLQTWQLESQRISSLLDVWHAVQSDARDLLRAHVEQRNGDWIWHPSPRGRQPGPDVWPFAPERRLVPFYYAEWPRNQVPDPVRLAEVGVRSAIDRELEREALLRLPPPPARG